MAPTPASNKPIVPGSGTAVNTVGTIRTASSSDPSVLTRRVSTSMSVCDSSPATVIEIETDATPSGARLLKPCAIVASNRSVGVPPPASVSVPLPPNPSYHYHAKLAPAAPTVPIWPEMIVLGAGTAVASHSRLHRSPTVLKVHSAADAPVAATASTTNAISFRIAFMFSSPRSRELCPNNKSAHVLIALAPGQPLCPRHPNEPMHDSCPRCKCSYKSTASLANFWQDAPRL